MPTSALGVLVTFCLFVFGTLVGSFLNVVSLRYDPDKFLFHRSVVGGRSHCPHCKKTLRWYELIPLLSFVVQRGKCRTCHARLTVQYPAVEILSGLILVFVPSQVAAIFNQFLVLSAWELFTLQGVWVLAFLAILLISMIDFRLRLIPDELNLFVALVGVAGIFLSADAFGQVGGSFVGHYGALFGIRDNIWLNHGFGLFAAALFFGLVILLTRGRAMGLGDLKLAAALGMLFGWPDVLAIMIFAFIIGSLVGICAIALQKKTMKSFIAFGPFLGVSAVFVFFYGFSFFDWYFSLLGGMF